MCVIFNPAAARGRAKQRLERIQQALGGRAVFQPTEGPGRAEELALSAAKCGFRIVAAAGGDGTVHEVANGVLRAGRPDVVFAVLPIGSANDYAFMLGLDLESQLRDDPPHGVRALDVGLVRTDDGRERYFVNSLGLGFSGEVTVQSRRIRWLQGLPLYTVGFLWSLMFHYSCPVMEIHLDQEHRKVSTLSLTVAIGKREGNLVVTRDAVPDDGLFDYLHAGALSRLEILYYLPRLATGGALPEHRAIWTGRCREVRVSSAAPLTVHLDGELFCLPPDNTRGLEIKLLPGLLRVQV
jgi:diacylglycerol kinase family enzyme